MFPLFQFLSFLLCFCLYPLLTLSFRNSSFELCHHEDKMALLRFKNGFTIHRHFSEMYDDVTKSYPKTKSWKETRDCCLWDGVTCDSNSGHVIGLDLNCSRLGGIIHHNSTLFHLSQLRSINLAYNNFHPSRISPNFGHFSNLKVLNLSHSGFSGVIPNHFSLLSRLVCLDLTSPSIEYDRFFSDFFIDDLPYTFVGLEIPHVDRIIRNLTHLRQLHLNGVLINSDLPQTLANLSSLSSLQLSYCNLQGMFHSNILALPHLRFLSVKSNPNLHLDLSEFNNFSSSLEVLNFSNISFSGWHPKYSLETRPPRLRNFLAYNSNISGTIPLWVWNTTEFISLSENQFTGELPSSVNVDELSQLTFLDLSDNLLKGPLPHWLWNLPSLIYLVLSGNQFNGKIGPSPKANFVNSSQPMGFLDISNNRIQGEIPTWVYSVGKDSLIYLNISHNNLTGALDLYSWKGLEYIDLSSNSLQGVLPLPKPKVVVFLASNNKFHGKINSSFCNLTWLTDLDLSNNHLSGKIPECFGKLSGTLELLDLGSNKFYGIIPIKLERVCTLHSMHLNNNRFEGTIPRSLNRCKQLEVLDLENNQFKDSFPQWLDNLPELKVLVLRSNNFQGSIRDELKASKNPFPKLQILDLSGNQFYGKLPTRYIRRFKALMVHNSGGHNTNSTEYINSYLFSYYQDSLLLTMKGTTLKYKILTILTVLDFSNNKFNGEIPNSLGKLVALVALNVSHNQLTGRIPPSLANLTLLESLDLSCNKLEGKIPQQLVSLTFLEVFSVSENKLVGPIPQSAQFNTFSSKSFEGNSGLCGYPLRKCRKEDVHDHQTATPGSEQEVNDIIDIITSISLWEIILIGFGLGATLGLVVGYYMLSSERPNWFSRKADKFEYVMVQRSKKLSKRRQRRT